MENLANKPSKRISVCFPAPLNIHHSEDRRMNTRLFTRVVVVVVVVVDNQIDHRALDSRLSRLAVSLDQFQEEKGITAQKGKSVLHIHVHVHRFICPTALLFSLFLFHLS
ncbi:hypothetical protein Tsp_06984 [Trichinella spiralis]|uniref:hypothetical protein n=1 Tax=Trichinella spiralis TaxID=6334 RepID=UPI0001EFB261|nr:hypothetical protein Tsp_06984 [Trichinella spiralis]